MRLGPVDFGIIRDPLGLMTMAYVALVHEAGGKCMVCGEAVPPGAEAKVLQERDRGPDAVVCGACGDADPGGGRSGGGAVPLVRSEDWVFYTDDEGVWINHDEHPDEVGFDNDGMMSERRGAGDGP